MTTTKLAPPAPYALCMEIALVVHDDSFVADCDVCEGIGCDDNAMNCARCEGSGHVVFAANGDVIDVRAF
jgi:hypothetical protein